MRSLFGILISIAISTSSLATAQTTDVFVTSEPSAASAERVRSVRKVVDEAARETSTEGTRRIAIMKIEASVATLTLTEKLTMFDEASSQIVTTSTEALAREMAMRNSASWACAIFVAALATAILAGSSNKASGIAGFIAGLAGVIALARYIDAEEISDKTIRNTRDLQKAIDILRDAVRANVAAQSLK